MGFLDGVKFVETESKFPVDGAGVFAVYLRDRQLADTEIFAECNKKCSGLEIVWNCLPYL